ncbi:MAG: hypothetical protein MHM6MM_004602 [Cercozoa sp. M6MM]
MRRSQSAVHLCDLCSERDRKVISALELLEGNDQAAKLLKRLTALSQPVRVSGGTKVPFKSACVSTQELQVSSPGASSEESPPIQPDVIDDELHQITQTASAPIHHVQTKPRVMMSPVGQQEPECICFTSNDSILFASALALWKSLASLNADSNLSVRRALQAIETTFLSVTIARLQHVYDPAWLMYTTTDNRECQAHATQKDTLSDRLKSKFGRLLENMTNVWKEASPDEIARLPSAHWDKVQCGGYECLQHLRVALYLWNTLVWIVDPIPKIQSIIQKVVGPESTLLKSQEFFGRLEVFPPDFLQVRLNTAALFLTASDMFAKFPRPKCSSPSSDTEVEEDGYLKEVNAHAVAYLKKLRPTVAVDTEVGGTQETIRIVAAERRQETEETEAAATTHEIESKTVEIPAKTTVDSVKTPVTTTATAANTVTTVAAANTAHTVSSGTPQIQTSSHKPQHAKPPQPGPTVQVEILLASVLKSSTSGPIHTQSSTWFLCGITLTSLCMLMLVRPSAVFELCGRWKKNNVASVELTRRHAWGLRLSLSPSSQLEQLSVLSECASSDCTSFSMSLESDSVADHDVSHKEWARIGDWLVLLRPRMLFRNGVSMHLAIHAHSGTD